MAIRWGAGYRSGDGGNPREDDNLRDGGNPRDGENPREEGGGGGTRLSAREERLAREAVLTGIREAEAVLDHVMARVQDRRSREELSRAVREFMESRGEPRFRISCYRCGEPVMDVALFYPSARGLWSWMPPAYLAALFNEHEDRRRCAACGASFPRVDLR